MLDKIRFVVEKTKFVKINNPILNTFISNINRSDVYILSDNNIFQDIENYEKKINILFIFSCLNFAFWNLDINQQKKEIIDTDTSKSIIKAISKLLHQSKTQSLSKVLINISLSQFTNLFSIRALSFVHERWHNIREAGLILGYRYNNSYMNLLKEADFNLLKALLLTIKYFPSFDDRSIYHGQEIEFHKRAQILLSTISTISNKSYRLKNVEKLIGGADYRIPQLFRHLKILQYSTQLEDKIDRQELILSASEEEVEIRALTLWVIELIKNKLNKNSKEHINSMEIDNYLWRINKKFTNMKPHHRTVSIYY